MRKSPQVCQKQVQPQTAHAKFRCRFCQFDPSDQNSLKQRDDRNGRHPSTHWEIASLYHRWSS
ncbi:hypothetical protein CKO51_20530 [Rhodopirellula sp. SM50]|nr:hypothetical protein CKO51_20530 [Rhodopirellula sp. SM50]